MGEKIRDVIRKEERMRDIKRKKKMNQKNAYRKLNQNWKDKSN